MNFSDALHYAKAGRQIRRATFSRGSYLAISPTTIGDYVAFYHPDFPAESWHPTHGDLLATDWEIVRDPALSGPDPLVTGTAVDWANRPGVVGGPEFEPLSGRDALIEEQRQRTQAAAEKATKDATPPAVEIAHAFEDLRDKLSRIFSPSIIHPAGLENLEVRLQEAEFWAARCVEQLGVASIYTGERLYRQTRGLR